MNESIVLNGFPIIDRYFPDCIYGCVEAVLRYKSAGCDLSPFFFDHQFHYKSNGKIEFDGSLNLNINFSTVAKKSFEEYRDSIEKTAIRIASIYGFYLKANRGFEVDQVIPFLLQSLYRNDPPILMFDLFHIKARREYKAVLQCHAVCIRGFDMDRKCVLAAEQMLGHIEIDFEDFLDCLQRQRREEEILIYQLSPHEGERQSFPVLDQIRRKLNATVLNLQSPSEKEGIAGFGNFLSDIRGAMPILAKERRPFYIPGIWRFSHQRAIVERCLEIPALRLQLEKGRFDIRGFTEFIARLKNRWFSFDMRTEMAIAKKDWELGFRSIDTLEALLEMERPAYEWYRAMESAMREN